MPTIFRFSGYLSSPFQFYSTYSVQKSRLIPNCINPLIHLLAQCQNIKDLEKIKSQIVVQGLMDDESHVRVLLKVCFHLGNSELALKIFEKLKIPSLFLQNLMIRRLSDLGLYKDLLNLYRKCQTSTSGCGSDNYTFPFVIKACASLRVLGLGKEAHCVALKSEFGENVIVQTTLVDMYSKTGRLESARILLNKIPQPDLASWNALLAGYSFNGCDHEAFGVFQKIQIMGFKPNVSTFASLIPICTRLRLLDVARSVHGLAIKCGVSLHENVLPALVSMYASGENLSVARELFDLLDIKNVATWNAMISACSKNRKTSEAFELFCQMLRDNVLPTFVTYVSIFSSCVNLDDIQYGESLHACVIKHGLGDQPSVVTSLLSMYAKLGDIDSAQYLFGGMSEKNLLSWNSMVSGYVQNALPEKSLATFREMQLAGVVPDSISTVSVLSACTRLKFIQIGMSAHAYCLRNGYDSNINVSNAILSLYCGCDRLPTSVMLLHIMVKRNVVSWNTLISICAHKGDVGTVVNFLRQMQHDDVKFDLVTMISVLPSYCETENLVHGMVIHGHAIKTGFTSEISLINALISMYVNCGDLDSGYLLFNGMHVRTVVSWNALITGYRHNNFHQDVMALFHQMTVEGLKPNYVTLLNILPICLYQLQGKSIHAYSIRAGDISEPPLLTSLMCMYARFENVDLCFSVFERAVKSNVSMWNALMSVHVQNGNSKYVFASLQEMLQIRVEPDNITMLTLISACVPLNSLNIARSLMAYIICKGFEKDVFVSNALIDLYCRCGYILIARKIFDRLIGKDTVSWSVMINGYGIHGAGEAALALFLQMKWAGVKPDDVTLLCILSACSHAGLVEQGRTIFSSMIEAYGLTPRMEHYACMVDLLGRTGRLAEAYDLVKTLPFKPSPSFLESLLGACRIHNDFEIFREVSELLSAISPTSCGSYVMLSNVYAAAGRWSDASRVRSKMEETRLRKIPGFSLIEVDSYLD